MLKELPIKLNLPNDYYSNKRISPSQRQFISDFSTEAAFSLTDADFGGFYDSSKNQYKFQITSYIQDILKGKLKQYDTFIAPVNVDYNRSVGPAVSALAPVHMESKQHYRCF
jgi:hypothetical protein